MFSPLMTVVWVAGLRELFRREEWRAAAAARAGSSWSPSCSSCCHRGKAYYLAGAILPLLAAGCVVVVERFRRVVAVGVVLALSALVAWPAMVPVLPARTYAASFYTAVDEDQLETIGWPELVATVRTVLAPLPDSAVVFTGNYGEAGALEWYGVRRAGLQRAQRLGRLGTSARRGRAGRGGRLRRPEPLTSPAAGSVATVPRVDGADNEEDRGPVFVCDAPREPWSKLWPRLVHLDA